MFFYLNEITIFFVCLSLILIIAIVMGRGNLLVLIILLELALISIILSFIIQAYIWDDMYGFSIIIFILTVAAAETAIGLAIVLIYYKNFKGLLTRPAANIRN